MNIIVHNELYILQYMHKYYIIYYKFFKKETLNHEKIFIPRIRLKSDIFLNGSEFI